MYALARAVVHGRGVPDREIQDELERHRGDPVLPYMHRQERELLVQVLRPRAAWAGGGRVEGN